MLPTKHITVVPASSLSLVFSPVRSCCRFLPLFPTRPTAKWRKGRHSCGLLSFFPSSSRLPIFFSHADFFSPHASSCHTSRLCFAGISLPLPSDPSTLPARPFLFEKRSVQLDPATSNCGALNSLVFVVSFPVSRASFFKPFSYPSFRSLFSILPSRSPSD